MSLDFLLLIAGFFNGNLWRLCAQDLGLVLSKLAESRFLSWTKWAGRYGCVSTLLQPRLFRRM